MDEDKPEKEEEQKPEEPAKDTDEGIQPKADGMLKDLYEENNRTEKLLKERKELLAAEKEFYARQKLGGITRAGQPPEKKEETPEEYKDRVLKGEL